jgi:SUMO ligase MMS21 Smc5/6 complex component
MYCPISLNLMEHPTIIRDCGHTFEKDIITSILLVQKRCPLCGKEAKVEQLCCDTDLKQTIECFK